MRNLQNVGNFANVITVNQTATAAILTHVPLALHKRVKGVVKRHSTTIAQFSRDAIEVKVKQIEAEEREAAEKPVKQKPPSELASLGQRPTVEISIAEKVDRVALLFEKHVRRLLDVHDDKVKFDLRQEEAFAEIRKFSPITYGHGNDHKIKERLENLIAEKAVLDEPEPVATPTAPVIAPLPPAPDMFAMLRQIFTPQQQAPVVEDSFVGKPINTTLVRRRVTVEE